MSQPQLFTLITGSLFIGFLTFLYLKYLIRKLKIKKFVINGSKEIKRVYYTLKKNKFKIINVNKEYKYTIVSDEGKIENKILIHFIAQKSKNKYAVFYNNNETDFNLPDEDIIFKMLVSNFKRGVIVNPDYFSLKEFKLYV